MGSDLKRESSVAVGELQARVDVVVSDLEALVTSAHTPDGVKLPALAETMILSSLRTLQGA